MYEQFFRTVRAVNAPLSPRRQLRVLLGDPPLDWSAVTSFSQLRAIAGAQRDAHPASVIAKQVLARGRRALICYGLDHLTHGGSLAGLLERAGERPYVIADFVPAAGDPGELARKFSRYARDMVIPTAGTWLGSVDAGLFSGGRCGLRLASVFDAALYLGQPENLTASWPNPAIFLDPVYWKELQRRSALPGGGRMTLDSYRQEGPVLYPLVRSQECGQA